MIVEQAGATTSIEHLVLDWTASALAGGTLHVEALELCGVVYRVNPDAPPPPDDAPLQLPERIDLPVGVRVDRVTVLPAEQVDWRLRHDGGFEPRREALLEGGKPDASDEVLVV